MNIPGYNQQPQQPGPVGQPRNPWDMLEGGGGPAALKFGTKDQYGRTIPAQVGTQYSGILTEDLESAFITDPETKLQQFWPDGKPKEQIIATLQNPQWADPADPEDYGIRRLFIKGQMFTALSQEMLEKKTGRIGPGTRITVTLIDLKPNKTPGYSPQNIFDVTLGPEIAPWIPPEQRAVDQAFANIAGTPQAVQQQVQAAQQAGFPTAAQVAALQQPVPQYQPPVPPQMQYQQQPFQPPAQNVAPVHQPAPQQPPIGDGSAYAAIQALAAQPVQQAPQAPAGVQVTQEDINSVKGLLAIGLPIDQAVGSWAETKGQGPEFIAALTNAVASQQ